MHRRENGIACLVLAAGGGTRLGGGKLLLPWRGEPIIAHAVRAALSIAPLSVTVVLGSGAEEVRPCIDQSFNNAAAPVVPIVNADWRNGQSASLRIGLETILASPESTRPGGVMVLLGDMPLIRPKTLAALSEAHLAAFSRDNRHGATAPVFEEKRGNPVILAPSLFPGVLALEGDTGARRILAALGDRLLLVPVDDPGVLRDIDTPEAYDELRKR